MDWYQNLYIGENIKKKKDLIIRKLEKKKRVADIQLIILPPAEQNQLEIIKADQLYRYIKQDKYIRIIGLASDMGEARNLIRQIAEDVYLRQGNVGIREYFYKIFDKSNEKEQFLH